MNATYSIDVRTHIIASDALITRYKTMNASAAFKDYTGSDGSPAFSIDSIEGKESLVDFDFGILYAVNENFRIGVHFQQPFLDFYWEFFEF